MLPLICSSSANWGKLEGGVLPPDIRHAGFGEFDEIFDGQADVEAALAAGDVDLVEGLRAFVEQDEEGFVGQGEGGDAAGLEAGQFFGFILGGQGDFFGLEGLRYLFEVYFLKGVDHGQHGFAGLFLGDDDGLEDHFRWDAQAFGGDEGAQFFGGEFEDGVGDLAGGQQAGDVVDCHGDTLLNC